MLKYRRLQAAAFSCLLLFIGLLLSWLVTVLVYYFWTEGDVIYSRVVEVSSTPALAEKVNISGWKTHYTRLWDPVAKQYRADLFVDGHFVTSVIAKVDTDTAGGESASLSWSHAGASKSLVNRLFGQDGGSETLFTLAKGWQLTPYTRDVTVGLPSGAMSPLLRQAALQGIAGAERSLEERYVSAFAKLVQSDIRRFFATDTAELRLRQHIAYHGSVQFVTVWLFALFCYLIVVSFWFEWAKDAAEMASSLIPFVGFFGTLLGMSSALGILGGIDLGDPLMKSIKFGPIGGALSFAIDTTIFAFVFYALSFLVYLVRIAAYDDEEYESLVTGQNWLSIRVLDFTRWVRGKAKPAAAPAARPPSPPSAGSAPEAG